VPESPFHLAIPVTDLGPTREFYSGLLGCAIGREAERWIDFDFFGHQLSAHLADRAMGEIGASSVDGKRVPVPHFGLILGWEDWERLADRLERAKIDFVIAPYIRFRGEPGEQATMFFRDPSGNFLEVKAFREAASVFAR